MRHRRQALVRFHLAKPAHRQRQRVVILRRRLVIPGRHVAVQFRQRQQAAPDAHRRPLLQQHLTVIDDRQHHRVLLRRRLLRLAHRQIPGAAGVEGHAARLHRTALARRAAARAQRGAHVHQALRVRLDALLRQQRLGAPPHRFLGFFLARIGVDAEHARKHALDVAVHDGRAPAAGKRRDRRRRRTADARQLGQQHRIGREHAVILRHHPLRALVQVACPRVVAQAAPLRHHFLDRRRRQVAQRGEARQEARVIAQHGGHLRLLQHDFRQPDQIGVAGVLPGQRMAAMHLLPANQV
ncbi:conserved hypothetical protein, partial [Ricinus communis]